MFKNMIIAIGFALVSSFALSTIPANAQVFDEFGCASIVQQNYVPLVGGTVIPYNNFYKPPTFVVQDPNDGYHKVNIGFKFEFNGVEYEEVWVCVNGFIQFTTPRNLPANLSTGLTTFEANPTLNNIVAPFWGDHYYRNISETLLAPFFTASRISYRTEGTPGSRVFTVEWKDLNINYEDNLGNPIPTSIANFQVKLYESADQFSTQGDIEFCYGQIGGWNPLASGNVVVTQGASVGIRGQNNDFMNALFNEASGPNGCADTKTKTDLTNQWTPSGATNFRLRFNANVVLKIDEWWGDGDADMSKGLGQRHNAYYNTQNRFVTINDVRVILRSIATKRQLDSLRRRAAYHADVNNDGRYYYDVMGAKQEIKIRSKSMFDDLPSGVGSPNQILFQANEYDAAIITHYLGARIPSMPWRYDTIPQYGKPTVGSNFANSIKFGEVVALEGDLYKVPIYLNGYHNGPLSLNFELNGNIIDVENAFTNVFADFDGGNFVLAGSGEFNNNEALVVLTVKGNRNNVSAKEVKFNDSYVGNLRNENGNDIIEFLEQNSPNPFNYSNPTTIKVNISENGFYTLKIFDLMGNVVNTLVANDLTTGEYNFTWNGTNQAGSSMDSGMYIYKLEGDNVVASKKMILNK